MQEKLKAYKAVHEVIIANKQHLNVSDFWAIENKIEQLEKSVEWSMTLEGHGTWYTHYLCNMNEAHVGLYGREFNRTISWSDDKRQPEGEWLCSIRFSYGAYMFNDSVGSSFYPEETFDAFFAELKAFGTAYCDTNNNVLYFTKDVAYKVCEAFPEIYKKYKALVVEEQQRQRVKELELELTRLKGN